MRKVRRVVYLEKKESELLKRFFDPTGATITEIARRAIGKYLKGRKAKQVQC